MPTEFRLPQLGEQVEKGVVLSVMVSSGDHVDQDEVVLELETDKATTEVPSPQAGTIGDVRVHEGDEIQSGDVIFTIDEDGEGGREARNGGRGARGEGREERQNGRREARGLGREGAEEKAEREEQEEKEEKREKEEKEEKEERRNRERREEKEKRRKKEERKEAKQREREPERKEREPEERRKPTPVRPGEPVPAPPSVRRFARELGVELSEVAGTGDGGRVSEDDIKSHVRNLIEELSSKVRQQDAELPDFSQIGEVERVPMSAIRRATSKKVSESWEKVPHVTQYDRADVSDLEKFRRGFADEAEGQGAKLTVTAILVKVVAEALERFPDFNASVDVERGELVRKKFINVGVAVDTDDGLLVPVLRDVDQKGLIEIAGELGEKAQKARARKLSREDLQGGSFSITNLGGLGTTRFTPIIGWPQLAILSVGRLETRPVWNGDEFEPREILPLGITYDHRGVDGADAARFLRWIAETLENPMRLTMGTK